MTHSPEYQVIDNWLSTILDLPWGKLSDEKVNLRKAKTILDNDHYGLHDIKDEVLEYLAVRKKLGKNPKSILCFCWSSRGR